MTYIWQDFNIKPILAETIVFRDGVFCPEFSTLESPEISKNYDLPVHIIYVGDLTDDYVLDINVPENVKNQKIFFSVNVNIKKNADFKIVIKNSGINSHVRGFVVLQNHGDLKFNVSAHHLCRKTGIFVKTRLVGYKNSVSELYGAANIYQYCEDCQSDIYFSCMIDNSARVVLKPVQKISGVPESASHSANIFEVTKPQIEYLHESGLSDNQINDVMRDAFTSNTDF